MNVCVEWCSRFNLCLKCGRRFLGLIVICVLDGYVDLLIGIVFMGRCSDFNWVLCMFILNLLS